MLTCVTLFDTDWNHSVRKQWLGAGGVRVGPGRPQRSWLHRLTANQWPELAPSHEDPRCYAWGGPGPHSCPFPCAPAQGGRHLWPEHGKSLRPGYIRAKLLMSVMSQR